MSDATKRAQEIKALVESNPGITNGQIAEQLGLTPGRVSQIVAPLKKGGDLEARRRQDGKPGVGLHISQAVPYGIRPEPGSQIARFFLTPRCGQLLCA